MRPATPTRAPCTRTLPVGVKVPSGFAVRALFLVIWNIAPFSDEVAVQQLILDAGFAACVVFRRQGLVPVVEVSCSSDGLNEVLYDT